jgi:hypothetical protein
LSCTSFVAPCERRHVETPSRTLFQLIRRRRLKACTRSARPSRHRPAGPRKGQRAFGRIGPSRDWVRLHLPPHPGDRGFGENLVGRSPIPLSSKKWHGPCWRAVSLRKAVLAALNRRTMSLELVCFFLLFAIGLLLPPPLITIAWLLGPRSRTGGRRNGTEKPSRAS